MRVALVHDWLVSMRGGERVLEAFCELYPDASLFTLVHQRGSCSPAIERMRIIPSFLDRLPGARRHHRRFWPLFAHAAESFDLRGFDVVLSSSSCVARGVVVPCGTPHICYCHTPMRYVWESFPEYFGRGAAGTATRLAASAIAPFWRVWEEASANRADVFIANSRNVARRILRRYGRDSQVIPPPVDLSRFEPRPLSQVEDYYLMVTAFVPYKRVDLAVSAFASLGLPLKIVGQGPEEKRLKALARGHGSIRFIDAAGDEEIARLYEGARALIFPGEEDAGITPLEAQAAGRPVIAFGRGGALETVAGLSDDGANAREATGIFFGEQTAEALCGAVRRMEASWTEFDPAAARRRAQAFDRSVFKQRIRRAVEGVLEESRKTGGA